MSKKPSQLSQTESLAGVDNEHLPDKAAHIDNPSKPSGVDESSPGNASGGHSQAKIMKTCRLVVGISGASGAILGIRLLEVLRPTDIATHLVLTPAAYQTIAHETNWQVSQVQALADVCYQHDQISAAIASGSYPTLGMVVIPCSIRTLSGIANSYSANLLTRAADVTMKEGHPLVLVVRETPLHKGHIRLMELASQAGAIIFPPVPAFYTHPQTTMDMVDQIVGRILARLGIKNNLYEQWKD